MATRLYHPSAGAGNSWRTEAIDMQGGKCNYLKNVIFPAAGVHPGGTAFYRMPVSVAAYLNNPSPATMTGANDVTLSPDETRMAIQPFRQNNQP